MFAGILETTKALHENGVFDFVSTIASPIISLAILFITLKHDRKQFLILLKQQQDEHHETVELMKGQHEGELAKLTEANQISIRPYLVLDKCIEARTERDNLYFRLHFTNKGNGTAVEIKGKYLDNLPGNYLCPVYKSESAIYGCACPIDFHTNVSMPNEKCYYEIYRISNENFDIISFHADWIYFSILFRDINSIQYEQEFGLQYSQNPPDGQIGINRVWINSPKQVDTSITQ